MNLSDSSTFSTTIDEFFENIKKKKMVIFTINNKKFQNLNPRSAIRP